MPRRGGALHCRGLSQKWTMPEELATDLATLALYDIVIFAGAPHSTALLLSLAATGCCSVLRASLACKIYFVRLDFVAALCSF